MMKSKLIRGGGILICGILIGIWAIYGLTALQYANFPQKTPVDLTGTTTEPNKNTPKILSARREVDNDHLFDLYKLDDYPNARLELTIEKGSVRIEIENRSEMYGEHYTLGTGESFTADIDELIAKYKYHIGMVVLPLDRENGSFSLSYQIIQKD